MMKLDASYIKSDGTYYVLLKRNKEERRITVKTDDVNSDESLLIQAVFKETLKFNEN